MMALRMIQRLDHWNGILRKKGGKNSQCQQYMKLQVNQWYIDVKEDVSIVVSNASIRTKLAITT